MVTTPTKPTGAKSTEVDVFELCAWSCVVFDNMPSDHCGLKLPWKFVSKIRQKSVNIRVKS